MSPVLRFAHRDSGAVTVDWVVMTAAVVGLGLGSVVAVRGGTGALGDDIGASLGSAMVADLGYQFIGLTPAMIADRRALYPTLSTAELTQWHQWRAPVYVAALTNGPFQPTGDFGNLSAGEMLDILYLHREELMRRGAYPVAGVDFDALVAMYPRS